MEGKNKETTGKILGKITEKENIYRVSSKKLYTFEMAANKKYSILGGKDYMYG